MTTRLQALSKNGAITCMRYKANLKDHIELRILYKDCGRSSLSHKELSTNEYCLKFVCRIFFLKIGSEE